MYYIEKLNHQINGWYKVKHILKVGTIYKCKENGIYYKYLGNRKFKEGNKIVDVGTFSIEMRGNTIEMSYFQIGALTFEK
jgi:hypothetical protein